MKFQEALDEAQKILTAKIPGWQGGLASIEHLETVAFAWNVMALALADGKLEDLAVVKSNASVESFDMPDKDRKDNDDKSKKTDKDKGKSKRGKVQKVKNSGKDKDGSLINDEVKNSDSEINDKENDEDTSNFGT